MRRRDFVKASLAGITGALLEWCNKNKVVVSPTGFSASYNVPTSLPPGKLRVQYIRENIPSFHVPSLHGKRYDDVVPDTLDIAERGKLCINALTSITDSNADQEVYWLATFYRNPPAMVHNFNDWVQNVEGMMESLPLLRVATGSTQNHHVDPVWMAAQLKTIGPDGLVYVPLRGRPWSLMSVAVSYAQPVWKPDGASTAINDLQVSQIGTPVACQRALATMTVYYLGDRNPMWKAAIERMVQRLSALAVDRGDYAYFPSGGLVPNGKFGSNAPMPSGIMAEENSGRMIQGLSQYYAATGYEPALQLAGKLANYIRYHAQYYDSDGPWIFSPLEKQWVKNGWNVAGLAHGGHGHGHGIGLVSVLEYAIAANDKGMIEFVRSAYDWAKSNQSSSLVGFFPEWYIPQYDRCETDTVADMLAMALKMSAAGVADYWDDVDRWTRNHFTESQLTSTDWVYRLAERSPRMPVAWNETGDRVPERNVGAFAGWSTGNDFGVESPAHPHSIQHCCTGNSPRTVYYIWEHILHYDKGQLRVNLLLNRASRWVDIYSRIPYQGKVELKVKAPLDDVLFRVPEWVPSNSPAVAARTQAGSRHFSWNGRYLRLGSARPGDVVSVTFPIPQRRTTETIGNVSYTLHIKGNTVVSIDPPGKNGPLYQREYYLAERAPARTVARFVPDETLVW
ncbi:MAG TPA: hypothetical protein VG206_26520 [Terriglobia bacterium]|nr:hypothetical protein [Terriglobia bacterium]